MDTTAQDDPPYGPDFFTKYRHKYQAAFGHDPGLSAIVSNLLSRLPPDALILDCGCGTGKPVSSMIVASGRRQHGIDFSPGMIDLAREQVPAGSFELADMLTYEPRETCDSVIAMLSLFMLSREELHSMANKWHSWVKPGGLLLIGVLNAEDYAPGESLSADGKFAGDFDAMFLGHTVKANLFTKEGWDELLEGAGFKIVQRVLDEFVPPVEAESGAEKHYFVIGERAG